MRKMILYWMSSCILSQCIDLSTWVMHSVLTVPVIAQARGFLITGDKIFIFAVSLGKVSSYNK